MNEMAQPSESLREILNGPQSVRNLIPVQLLVVLRQQFHNAVDNLT
jgi:hypothetical protein